MTDKTAEEQRKEDFKKESDAKSKVIDFIHNWLWSSPDRATEGPIPREWIGDTSRMIREYAEAYSRERVEALEKEMQGYKNENQYQNERYVALESQLSAMEERLKAAGEVIRLANELLSEALEKYNALKKEKS